MDRRIFGVHTCINIKKKPELAPHQLKYMSFVMEMQKLHGDSAWISYYESFRRIRESVDLPCQKPVEEVRGKATALSTKRNFGQPFRGKQATAGRSGGLDSLMPTTREIDANQPPVPSHTFAKIVKQTTQILNVKITHSPTLTLKLPTPVKPEKLSEELQGYDEQLKKYLIDGFTCGFSLGCTETTQSHIATNHKSTASHA